MFAPYNNVWKIIKQSPQRPSIKYCVMLYKNMLVFSKWKNCREDVGATIGRPCSHSLSKEIISKPLKSGRAMHAPTNTLCFIVAEWT